MRYLLDVRGIISILFNSKLLAGGGAFAALSLAWIFPPPQVLPGQDEPPSLQISGAMVVFYGPTRGERDSLAALEGLEIDDLIDDFNLLEGRVAVYLGRRAVPYVSTTSRFIRVHLKNSGTRVLERARLLGPVGIVLSDGFQNVSVIPGVQTDQELITQINEFFHLPPR